MRNPDQFPAENSGDELDLRELYPDPRSMVADLASGRITRAHVHQRFPDIDDAEDVIYAAEGLKRDEYRRQELAQEYPDMESFISAYMSREVEMEDIPLRFPDAREHAKVQHLIDKAQLERMYPDHSSIADAYRHGLITDATIDFRYEDEGDQKKVRELIKKMEAADDEKLGELLEDPQNKFLNLPQNMKEIENASSAGIALQIARDKIWERDTRTFQFESLRKVEGVELGEVDVEGVKKTIEAIKEQQQEIGRGGDAFVVIYKGEQIEGVPPEVCYKFALEETTKRGRNSVAQEANLHTSFYETVNEGLADSKFGVPMPYYATEVGSEQMIAMEKLQAKSVDDILRGKGTLPEWLNVDEFCDELVKLLDYLHENGLFHRDMHNGNVMIRQTLELPEDGKWGYLIDFGLSGWGREGMEPYAKEVAGTRFTYNDDYGIVKPLRQQLKNLRQRGASNNGTV